MLLLLCFPMIKTRLHVSKYIYTAVTMSKWKLVIECRACVCVCVHVMWIRALINAANHNNAYHRMNKSHLWVVSQFLALFQMFEILDFIKTTEPHWIYASKTQMAIIRNWIAWTTATATTTQLDHCIAIKKRSIFGYGCMVWKENFHSLPPVQSVVHLIFHMLGNCVLYCFFAVVFI